MHKNKAFKVYMYKYAQDKRQGERVEGDWGVEGE